VNLLLSSRLPLFQLCPSLFGLFLLLLLMRLIFIRGHSCSAFHDLNLLLGQTCRDGGALSGVGRFADSQ